MASAFQIVEDAERGIRIERQPGDPDLAEERACSRLVAHIDVDGDHFKSVAAELRLEPVEGGHLRSAGSTPGRPQIEEDCATREIGERQRSAVRRSERKIVEALRRNGHPEGGDVAGCERLDPGRHGKRPIAAGRPAIAIARYSDIYRDRAGKYAGDGGNADEHQAALPSTNVRHPIPTSVRS